MPHSQPPRHERPPPPTSFRQNSTATSPNISAIPRLRHRTSEQSLARDRTMARAQATSRLPTGTSQRTLPTAPPEPPSPPLPAKPSVLKRLTTRLTSARSSSSLRPPTTSISIVPALPALQSRQNAAPTPRPRRPSTAEDMAARSRLSAYFERGSRRREERREEKERDARRAVDARRAAALRATGLLPASRRYSTALPDDFDIFKIPLEASSSNLPAALEATVESEGELSAAEVVIRAWRERNETEHAKDAAKRSGEEKSEIEEMKVKQGQQGTEQDGKMAREVSTEAIVAEQHSTTHERGFSGPTPSSSPGPSPPRPRSVKNSKSKPSKAVKAEERAALDSWRFPTSVSAPVGVNPGRKASSGTQCSGEHGLDLNAGNPASNQDIPPPPPTKDSLDKLAEEGERLVNSVPKAESSLGDNTSPRSPIKSMLPVPTNEGKKDTTTVSSSSSSESPTRGRGRGEKLKLRLPPSAAFSTPSIEAATSSALGSAIQTVPTLSPTMSTRTSASTTLPRTPSSSSRGHDNVRILEAPMELEEDELLAAATASDAGVSHGGEPNGKKESNVNVQMASLTSEFGEMGNNRLLPRSEAVSRLRPSATLSTAERGSKNRISSLFVRRRNTDHGAPVVNSKTTPRIANGLASAVPSLPRSLSSLRVASDDKHAGQEMGMGSPQHPSNSYSAGLLPRKKLSIPRLRVSSQPPSSAQAMQKMTNSGTSMTSTSSSSASRSTGPGVGLRTQALNPTIHSRGSILVEAHAIQDDESRRLCEMAFLDY